MGTSVTGLASGFDWQSMIDQLVEVERAPQKRLRSEQSTINLRKNALASVTTQLKVLRDKASALKDGTLFDTRKASVSDSTLATVSAATGTTLGTYNFNITQLAAAASWRGQANVGQKLSTTGDLSFNITEAGLATTISAGTFTVNGKQIQVETTDTLQGVFDKISSQTGNTVTASYDAATDKVTLAGSSPVVLGSATDTSNFLSALKLANNGTNSVSSGTELGAVRVNADLSEANLATPVSGTGEFKINGVSFAYDSASDSIADILARINNSDAGVTASYDSINDRMVLSNRTTGDVGIALEDVSGNFLTASGLAAGTLERGKNLLYNINGGGQLSSQTNVIGESSSGIAGLSVTALAEKSFSVTVGADTEKIKNAIQTFVTEYNKAQSLINTQTASSTDADGKVTAGVLAQDSETNDINSSLRSLFTSDINGMAAGLNRLDDLGFKSNGTDDALSTTDLSDLDDLLATNLNGLRTLFSKADSGLALRVDSYLENVVGDNGSLIKHQDSLTQQSTSLDKQIEDQEKWVQSNRQAMVDSFVAMETAQAKINQQLQYISQNFS